MVNILLCGPSVPLGQKVIEIISKKKNMRISACIDPGDQFDVSVRGINSYYSFNKINEPIDVILVVSPPDAIIEILEFAEKIKKPVVVATNGYSTQLKEYVKSKAKILPIFKSENLGLGFHKFLETVAAFAAIWDGDIEIVETHSADYKKAPPSDASLMIARGIISARRYGSIVIGRTQDDYVRQDGDVCISSIRGGIAYGKYEIRFYNENGEIFTTFREYGPNGRAIGALEASEFMATKKIPGLYSMNDLEPLRKPTTR